MTRDYNKPAIEDLGTLAEITLGGLPTDSGDVQIAGTPVGGFAGGAGIGGSVQN